MIDHSEKSCIPSVFCCFAIKMQINLFPFSLNFSETPVSEERSNKDNGILHLDTNNTKDLLFTENEKVDIHSMNKLPADAKLVSVTKPCTEQIVVA